MAFTYEELIALDNPYEELSTGDALAENAKVLNSLSNQEQVMLATKMIAACPETRFKEYSHHIEALGRLAHNESTFHAVLTAAYEVRHRISSLLDPRNKTPHTLFSKEFNPGLFHRFSALANLTLESNESAIAERLALCAPEDERSKIAHNLSIAFPKHILAEKTRLAFTLRRNVETFLLSDNPEKFFISRDYSSDTCNMFVNMFRSLLAGHEQTIGKKLCGLDAESRSSITRRLELLHTEVFDETNPFKLIADSMNAKLEQNRSQASNAHGLFNHGKSKDKEECPGNNKLDEEKELSCCNL
ncbi:hypothetical protein OQJ18_12345 [Fluoribacter dumoffii]|uniref:Uncharacterized protein n=1 Tax=Fluoribacter dumoffii TaxID=463 RepID=A0A377G5C7_9GAMM|nr:lpg0008 family Dot/Icm T4SS effector [Fluoribacter dumoffii]KTC91498.1 hypothetical protein Ldum_2566 [Fluoribacter dumoffii NY 23]MCW8387378.1 hypothetical protein [Fluoribacter dumoffii]MCW8417115.1 hypothetical protein [Fluoribacter dumoffii]MCW8455045.1 hypothetical protein [Fluoribacter dumoffii]MCW8460878.1 hypothetical protein [Fluoribacter dumoffii]